jgi:hypothetical protein
LRTVTVDQAMSQACAVYPPVGWGFERTKIFRQLTVDCAEQRKNPRRKKIPLGADFSLE